MKSLSLIAIGLVASAFYGRAQDSLAPSAVTPKQPESAVSTQPRQGQQHFKSPRPNPAGDKPIIADKPDLRITGVVLVKTRAEVQDATLSVTGLQVRDIPFLNKPDFNHVIQPFIGKILTENAIRDLEDAIILYCRNRGKLLVDVILVPEQNIENGVIQLWFLEGKVGHLSVKNEGHKWFTDQFILKNVRLRPDGPINSIQLTEDLNWLNGNPFRQVDVAFKPGNALGLTDVDLQVVDRVPFRPYVGYENSGTRFTGEDRLLGGFNWGNAFGLDHQLNYQYSTDVNFDLVKAHSASYLAPLPWRHNLLFYGSYVEGKADFSSIGSTESAKARSWQVSGRYSVPLPNLGKYRHEAAVGFDFKRSNNDLLAGGTNILQTSDTDIAQIAGSYSGLMPDHWGETSFGVELYYSPGGITDNNSDADFSALRTNAPANYFYGRLNIERITRLPYNFSWVLRAWGQLSSDRLLPSEELALGGYNTIRGYDERVVIGDNGWIINNELRSPPMPLGLLGFQDQLQILGFFDYGGLRLIDPIPADGLNVNNTLYSTGVGLRYTVSHHVSFRFDYGIPLIHKEINAESSRFHAGVLVSF
jgi:hemolysin activation/secretion protein